MKKVFFIIFILCLFLISCNAKQNEKTNNENIEPTKEETVVPTEIVEPTPVEPTVKEPTVVDPTPVIDTTVTLKFIPNLHDMDEFKVEVEYNQEYELHIYKPRDYIFVGWKSSIDEEIYTVYPGYEENYQEIIYTGVWVERFDLENYLNEKFGIIDENSEIELDATVNDLELSWDIPNLKVLSVKDNKLTINKMYQSHHEDTFDLTLNATYKTGYVDSVTKKISIHPIVFPSLSDTPIATYFSVGAMSSYKNSSSRYKKERTLFGEHAKKTLNICYYAFITINSDTTCQLGNSSVVDEILELRNHGIRVVGSIAGTSLADSTLFANFTSDEELCQRFVWNLVNLMERYNFDGLDIDWESTAGQYVVASGMTNLCKALRVELDSRQAEGGTKYLLTAAVPASSWGAGDDRYNFKEINNYLDYINLMSYDANNSNVCSHLAPLYSSSYDNGYGFGCDYGVKLLESKGFPRNKILIGAAGYGKGYKVSSVKYSGSYPMLGSSASLTQIANVPDSYATGTLFNSAIDILLNNSNYKSMTEYNRSGQIVGSFLYSEKDLIFVTYDSKEVIKEKYIYSKATYGLGMMNWCYCEDTSDWYVDTLYEMMYSD